MEDAQIVELYFSRDQQAVTETERRYGARLRGFAGGILKNPEDTQECVNDTYLKAWVTIPPQRPQCLFAYLAAICRNLAFGRLDWENAAKRKAEVVSLSEEMALCIPDRANERLAEGKELGRILNEFLTGLPKESRVIFLRRYWFCDSIGEIARRYGYTESEVKVRLHRTRALLRTYLEQEGVTV